MRVGYSMWGFLGNGVTDTPDGSRAYRRPFADAILDAGHDVIFLQVNRDLLEAGDDLTSSYQWDDGLPQLDALILEWRWPLPGRNTTGCEASGHTCDLHRQTELVAHYTRRQHVPTLIWDLDRQLPPGDPLRDLRQVAVGEFALLHTPGSHLLSCPVPDALLDTADAKKLAEQPRSVPLVYVGNQYDRDDHFDQFFAPAAKVMPHLVAGKWPRTEAWPHVSFAGRAAFTEVAQIHKSALATVLLLPDRYWRVGHMTSRWWEALLAGCLPLVPAEMRGADAYLPRELHVNDGQDVIDRLAWLQAIAGTREHADLLTACLARLEPFRCSAVARTALSILKELA
ncbi:hypothetical protein [Micromonospora thermarum]|uniref:Glycosyltransferase n=1 Tax=Micromonospora thermarum TaxID=2720024 RepID=A0ABX0ZD12_9ACTN|nr:hypothetical protein [Micromonospora thermarum]NJP35815.1 hypothetical protein [Micromonospora thermarum]